MSRNLLGLAARAQNPPMTDLDYEPTPRSGFYLFALDKSRS